MLTEQSHHHLVLPPWCHLAEQAGIGEVRKLAGEVDGINRKTAVVVPAILGSMQMFWFSIALTLCSLPAVLAAFDHEVLKDAVGLMGFFPAVIQKVSLIALVAWVAQTFIQLVALPVLQVSNNAQMAAQEQNTKTLLTDGEATRDHTEKLLDAMDLKTEGGLKTILDAIEARHQ